MVATDKPEKTIRKNKLLRAIREEKDGVRIACEWLDAQLLLSAASRKKIDFKRLISEWAGREISRTEVDTAAAILSAVKTDFSCEYISPRLTFPTAERLRGISEAFRHDFDRQHLLENYYSYEIVKYSSPDGLIVHRSFLREKLPDPQYDGNEFCSRNDDCRCYYCVYGR